jgi:hypothetical protein
MMRGTETSDVINGVNATVRKRVNVMNLSVRVTVRSTESWMGTVGDLASISGPQSGNGNNLWIALIRSNAHGSRAWPLKTACPLIVVPD